MVLVDHTGWKLRRRQWTGTTEQLIEELESTYDNAPNMFSIRIHHGGKFQSYPGRMYVSGRVDIFDMVDIDLFTIVALNMMVLKLGYTEIRASTDAALRNQGASIKTLEIQIGQMSKVLQERGFESLPSSTETNPRDQVKSISTTIEVDSHPIRRIRSTQYVVSTGHETRQTKIPFPSRLNGYYCDGKNGSYGPQFSKAYFEAS
ncbi:hypothetical protein Tco_1250888 [Tanacetum coccineum]